LASWINVLRRVCLAGNAAWVRAVVPIWPSVPLGCLESSGAQQVQQFFLLVIVFKFESAAATFPFLGFAPGLQSSWTFSAIRLACRRWSQIPSLFGSLCSASFRGVPDSLSALWPHCPLLFMLHHAFAGAAAVLMVCRPATRCLLS
jgi:hypothetical protein